MFFLNGLGAPESIDMRRLMSWTEHADTNIKHYSGVARYQTTFDIPSSWLVAERGVELDLGALWAVGRVSINGKDLGILWKPPYRLDVTSAVKPGPNQLTVEVANTWSNRLVGDAFLPEEQRYCRTNITHSGTPGRPWKQIPLHESGLLGPVQLTSTAQVVVRP